MPIFPESPDVKYSYFFLGALIPHSSPYGIDFATSGEPHMIGIFDSAGNAVFQNGSGYVDFREVSIVTGAVQAYTAETDAILTATEPTLAANTTYGFYITQYNPTALSSLRGWVNPPIYISANTGTGPLTAGTIATLWASQVNLLTKNNNLQVTATSSGAVLTITANAGYPLVLLNNPVNGVTLAVSTAGVQSLGNSVDLLNAQYTEGAEPQNFVSTGHYNLVEIVYYTTIQGGQKGTLRQKNVVYLWVNTLIATYYSDWETYFLSVAQGTISGFAVSALKISS